MAAIRIAIRWTSVLAYGDSPTICNSLITADIYPRPVSKDVPTLLQIHTNCQRQKRLTSRTAQKEFVMASMGLAKL